MSNDKKYLTKLLANGFEVIANPDGTYFAIKYSRKYKAYSMKDLHDLIFNNNQI